MPVTHVKSKARFWSVTSPRFCTLGRNTSVVLCPFQWDRRHMVLVCPNTGDVNFDTAAERL